MRWSIVDCRLSIVVGLPVAGWTTGKEGEKGKRDAHTDRAYLSALSSLTHPHHTNSPETFVQVRRIIGPGGHGHGHGTMGVSPG